MSKRQLSVYEKNHLLSHGIKLESIDEYGEMPVEYITGAVRFLDRQYRVTPDTLIPRVETEQLVELVIQELLSGLAFESTHPLKVLDVGTGSGVIGLSLLDFAERNHIPLDITLTDISPAALAVAQRNFEHLFSKTLKHGAVQFAKSDLLSKIPQSGQFICIVANLPYIPSERIPSLASSVKDFEPRVALDGGESGFDLIERLVRHAPPYLAANGKLFLEIDDSHTPELFVKNAPAYLWECVSDHSEKPRFAIGTLK